MTSVVYKQQVPIAELIKGVDLTLHAADILSVRVQNDTPTVWYACVPDGQIRTHRLFAVMTGQPFDYDSTCRFLGTILMDSGAFVLHVFESAQSAA